MSVNSSHFSFNLAATKSKLASLNEKLDTLERRWSFLKIKKVLHQRTPLFLVDISKFIVDDEYNECSM
ncbi:hypothetical protein MRB53_012432 [Persea americana]|uniref:Uncharacterized protein n=1 Tax=Persea americana TaxID=3435 RepID=A0ACC2LXN6_PERAE|nr:hypothetical protein MRB53_012432 [Persea americana]